MGPLSSDHQISPFALNIAMAGSADEAKRDQLGRASLQALGLCFPLRPRVEPSQQQRQHHHYPDWDLLDPSSWSG